MSFQLAFVLAWMLLWGRRERLNKQEKDFKMDIKEIIEAVTRCYDTSVSDILSSSRDEKTITARHVAIYLAHSCLPMSLLEIAKAFNRTHATILFAERKVRERMSEDDVFRSEVEQLRRKIEMAEQPKNGETTSKACDAPFAAQMPLALMLQYVI